MTIHFQLRITYICFYSVFLFYFYEKSSVYFGLKKLVGWFVGLIFLLDEQKKKKKTRGICFYTDILLLLMLYGFPFFICFFDETYQPSECGTQYVWSGKNVKTKSKKTNKTEQKNGFLSKAFYGYILYLKIYRDVKCWKINFQEFEKMLFFVG